VAAIRADIHNTSARQFTKFFEPADFMPGAKASLEDQIAALVKQGYTPSQAAAIATSKQSNQQKLHIVERAARSNHAKQSKTRRRTG
jgi:hypothetical protein